jgi:preprotein translocase subunit SecG
VSIILIVLHVILSLGIITLVLLQKGAGASAGAAFGGGGGGSVFGATGSANFLSKTTAIFAVGFFVNSLVLAYLAANRDMHTDSVLDALTAPATEVSVPANDISSEALDVPQADVPAAAEAETPAPAPTATDGTTVDESATDVPPPGE